MQFIKTYKDQNFIYFLTEYVKGLELYDVIRIINLLNTQESQFYIGSMILAIEYLHMQGVIYRDLKPENIMIDHTVKPSWLSLWRLMLLLTPFRAIWSWLIWEPLNSLKGKELQSIERSLLSELLITWHQKSLLAKDTPWMSIYGLSVIPKAHALSNLCQLNRYLLIRIPMRNGAIWWRGRGPLWNSWRDYEHAAQIP